MFDYLGEQVHHVGEGGGGGAHPCPLRDEGVQQSARLPLRPLLCRL